MASFRQEGCEAGRKPCLTGTEPDGSASVTGCPVLKQNSVCLFTPCIAAAAPERASADAASASSWSLPHCSCSQCTSVRASSAAAVCVTSTTRQKMFRAHSACARRHAALWRHAACGSTQASAAQRRLMLTPLHAFGRLGRTTACPFDVITMSCQHKSCRESREKHDGTK